MKLPIILFLFLLSGFFCFGQTISNQRTTSVYEVDPILKGKGVLFIPVDFNAFELKDKIPLELKSSTIERIDLVYTTFKENPNFDQDQLNNDRIARLQGAWPETQNHLIHWNLIGQTQAIDKTAARNLFHGFVIYYREKPTPESMENEIDQIDAYLRDGTFPAEMKTLPVSGESGVEMSTHSTRSDNVEESVAIEAVAPVKELLFTYSTDGALTLSEKELRKRQSTPVATDDNEHPRVSMLRSPDHQNECYTSEAGVFLGDSKKFHSFNDSMMMLGNTSQGTFSYDGKKEKHATKFYYLYYFLKPECDTTYSVGIVSPYTWDSKEFNAVQATFDRHPKWQNTLVIMDVTGSMSPYIAKTMAWVRATQDSSRIKAFTFFNDGDATPDRKKKTGQVGGIYGVENESYSSVYRRMKYTMRKGGGGDCPENNIEATIDAMEDYPNSGEVIMVADNWATPRDLALLDQIDVPIHFILCGAQMGINIAYLQAAYDSGGSVHTIEDDLDMRSIKPGKQFRIGRNYFTISKGKIIKAEHK